ncbi:hypothetical protein BG841_09985 [Marinobacter sp. X15-166B]|nr:hypothetical protein BG841_09985 [Marinobacter sp. X15-166B]
MTSFFALQQRSRKRIHQQWPGLRPLAATGEQLVNGTRASRGTGGRRHLSWLNNQLSRNPLTNQRNNSRYHNKQVQQRRMATTQRVRQ